MPEPSGRSPNPPAAKPGLHPRNRHAGGYDFRALVQASPGLGAFLLRARHGGPSINFADPEAVKALNRALLAEAYGIRDWDLPPGYLCPPIPGRADYVHHLADLLAVDTDGAIPRGPTVRVLDVGVGANAIYPLIGHSEYGWAFLGTDIDPAALASAARILAANPDLGEAIKLRRQLDRNAIFLGVLQPGESFDLTLCNPPFHGSMREVRAATQAKWRKLGRAVNGPARNFGGQGPELWCEGGEVGFIRRMVSESADLGDRVRWFTTLVASSASLPAVHRALRQVEARDIRTVAMAQGQKQSRFVAWTFLSAEARRSFGSSQKAREEERL
jgi:23S rRNA (adenine1618-N6)-methyltransferase